MLAEEGSRQGGQEGWLEGRDIAEARERAAWHEAMHRRNASTSEKLQVGSACALALTLLYPLCEVTYAMQTGDWVHQAFLLPPVKQLHGC